jgi:hypothetical protein
LCFSEVLSSYLVTCWVGGAPGVVRAVLPSGCYLTLIAVQAFATAVYSTLPAP